MKTIPTGAKILIVCSVVLMILAAAVRWIAVGPYQGEGLRIACAGEGWRLRSRTCGAYADVGGLSWKA